MSVTFTPHLSTNRLPDHLPKVYMKSVEVIPFSSRFVTDVNEINEMAGVFMADTELHQKLKVWAPSFMRILLERHAEVRQRVRENTLTSPVEW